MSWVLIWEEGGGALLPAHGGEWKEEPFLESLDLTVPAIVLVRVYFKGCSAFFSLSPPPGGSP